MTRELARTMQAAQSGPAMQAIRVTVLAINAHTVTVALPGGSSVAAPRTAGLTYTVGGSGFAILSEPAVVAVLPVA